MNIFHDKQVRYYGIFLLFISLLLFLSGMGMHAVQSNAIRSLFLSHNQNIVTSLLEQGISKDIIVKAITNTTSSQEGMDLLTTIGLTEHTAIRFFPLIQSHQQTSWYFYMLTGIFLSSLLFCGAFIFLWKREQLYLQAKAVIDNYIEGNISSHLPFMKEGTIYQLFTSIERLFKILQSRHETGNKAKEFLKNTISDISHQLKTPLTALIMYHEIISDEPDNLKIVKEYSTKTGLALKRMEQLIQSMLKITRLDAGSIVFEKNWCSISELISYAIGELTTRATNEEKEIIIDDLPDYNILCDKQWTSEAIGNIVKNALDHTDSGGEIHISWLKNPAMLRLFICDNGTGIPANDIHHIFKRFYRSKNFLDTPGVGLGLSISKSIIEGQGGVLLVKSDLDKGSVFTISFLTEM